MHTFAGGTDFRAIDVRCDDHSLLVTLNDGRTIVRPLSAFPRLLAASPLARQHWVLLNDGEGIHWPEADEDLHVATLARTG
jgi:hypothetical protein